LVGNQKTIKMSYKTITPSSISTADLHQYMLAAVAPRPIAFVSTIDEEGNPNLAPYSFFNAFSSNPPIVVFSSNRRVRDNTTKDTLHNVMKTGEVVINVVSHSIVNQAAVAGIEYPKDINEFEKAGLTPLASDLVKPFRVAESPVQMECKVMQIIPLGEHGGAGNLIMCEIVKMHINENVLGENGKIDQHKIDLMGRMGRIWYTRASGNALLEINQPVMPLGIGFDGLPPRVRESAVLTGNEIAMLAGLPAIPTAEECKEARELPEIAEILATTQHNVVEKERQLHIQAKFLLAQANPQLAFKVVMLGEY
jgi:flavin reductase (DIM6/NTAB) family NADH-FMN oxidoreductase RutF